MPELKRDDDHEQEAGRPAAHGSALRDALALVDFGPCKDAFRPQEWVNVAAPMCAHCLSAAEDVNLAAARIITAQYRELRQVLEELYNLASFDWDTMPEAGRREFRKLVFKAADRALSRQNTERTNDGGTLDAPSRKVLSPPELGAASGSPPSVGNAHPKTNPTPQ